jgi:atypical dual specificity phosphatase
MSQYTILRNAVIVLVLAVTSTLLKYTTSSSHLPVLIPILPICYRSYHQHYINNVPNTTSIKGFIRLCIFISSISIWCTVLLSFIIESIAHGIFHYHAIDIHTIKHLFPYVLLFVVAVRDSSRPLDPHSIRSYLIHILYDIPAIAVVLGFKLIGDPLNSLYTKITEKIYLGALPTYTDARVLHDIGIKGVVNLCREYGGPRQTYEKYGIQQLHIPTVDSTSPSLENVEKAMKFIDHINKTSGAVFVHCKAGMGRSATVVFCHLIVNEHMKAQDAIELMKRLRPEISTDVVKYASVRSLMNSLNISMDKEQHANGTSIPATSATNGISNTRSRE